MTGPFVQLIFGGVGLGGLISAGIALFKLRPDVNSAAVIQAQGAMDAMQKLYIDLRNERDYYKEEVVLLRTKISECEDTISKLRGLIRGWELFNDDNI